jgi:hypothetical protein
VEITSTVPSRSPFDRTGQKPSNRSKVANGRLLPLADGRSATARRFRDLYGDIANDLGGIDHLSEGQRQLIRRAAMLSAECERMETQAARDERRPVGEIAWKSDAPHVFDLEVYGQLCDRLGRLFGRLGLERKSKDVTPDLRSYLAGKDLPA